MDDVNWRRLFIPERGGGRWGPPAVRPLQLLHGERDGRRGGGRLLLAGRQLAGRHPGGRPAGQHQSRVYGGGRTRVEDIIENTEVTQLHQVLGFQIDHWLQLLYGLTISWGSFAGVGQESVRCIYIFRL